MKRSNVPTLKRSNVVPSPCYVLEEALLINNLERIHYIQEQAGVSIICALKGYALYPTFPLLNQYLSGATASSLNEARLCFEEMGHPAHLCSPAYRAEEMKELIHYSSHITFNSLNQWKQFKQQIQNEKKGVKCALRINPEFSEVEFDIYNPCVAGSRLGIRASELGNQLPDGITGLHFHTLCESSSFSLERTLQEIEKNFAPLLQQADWINMGGGHLMTRKTYALEHLIQILKTFKEKYQLEIILEPGEAIAWQAGYLLSTVLDTFDSNGIQAVVLDCSIANHMPDCIEMPYKPKVHGASDQLKNGYHPIPHRLGGMTCLAGDFVGDYYFENSLEIGDQIIFEDMIHYTMVKNNTFNGINLPSIGIIKTDGTFTIMKSFGYEDFKNRLG